MCACVVVHSRTCRNVCICIPICACVCTHVYVWMYERVCLNGCDYWVYVCICMHMFACVICVYSCVFICSLACGCMCECVQMGVSTWVSVCLSVYEGMCVHVHVCRLDTGALVLAHPARSKHEDLVLPAPVSHLYCRSHGVSTLKDSSQCRITKSKTSALLWPPAQTQGCETTRGTSHGTYGGPTAASPGAVPAPQGVLP